MELSMLVVLKFEILVASATGFSDYFKRAVPANPILSELTDVCVCVLDYYVYPTDGIENEALTTHTSYSVPVRFKPDISPISRLQRFTDCCIGKLLQKHADDGTYFLGC